jgi:hypothetical protein
MPGSCTSPPSAEDGRNDQFAVNVTVAIGVPWADQPVFEALSAESRR